MEVEVDWDLHAVVRGCSTHYKKLQQPDVVDDDGVKKLDKLFCYESRLKLDSFTPSIPTPQPQPERPFELLLTPFLISPIPTSTTTALVESKKWQPEDSISSSNYLIQPRKTTTATNSTTPRSKRRKNQFKKVCQVPAEGLATDDTWSWRKYGQKPIKGSPYPRGYYRCSSSKGCPARKQVERSRTDPNMFIITYTAEHNHPAPTHRNSLAGVSRHQNSNKVTAVPISSSKAGTGTSSSSVPTSPSDDDEDMQQSIKTEDYQLDEILCNELHQEEAKEGVMLDDDDDDFFDGLDEMKLPTGQQVSQI